MILDQCYVINEIISLCKESHYQDVTIICQNGAFSSNSFLLAAIFPIFRNIMKPLIEFNDSVVVSVPDLDKNELESFCHSLYSQNPKYVSKSIIHQLLKNYIKEEFCNEDVPDYSSVDIDPDNAELNIVDEINEDYEDMHKDPVVLSLKKEKNVHNIKKTILNGRKSPKIAKRKSDMKKRNKRTLSTISRQAYVVSSLQDTPHRFFLLRGQPMCITCHCWHNFRIDIEDMWPTTIVWNRNLGACRN